MNESHFLAKALLVVGGLILVGWLAFEVIGLLFHVLLWVAFGALVVGGAMILYGRAKKSITSGNYRRRINR